MAARSSRPELPDLPAPRFDPIDEALDDAALKERLKTVGGELGFGSRTTERRGQREGQGSRRQPPAMKTLQLIIPDYLFEQLHMDAARQRVTKKYLVLQALIHAGYRVDRDDLEEDGRRNRG